MNQFHHLDIFSALVGAAGRSQSLFPSVPSGAVAEKAVRDILDEGNFSLR